MIYGEEVIEKMKEVLRDNFLEGKVIERKEGVKKIIKKDVFIKVKREGQIVAIKTLLSMGNVYLIVMSGEDKGDVITVNYHFSLNYANPGKENVVTISMDVPKNYLKLISISNIFKGATTTEREMHEMLGIDFIDLKDKRHLFLPEDWPEGKYPWRKDEHNVEDMVKFTHKNVRSEVKKNE